VPYSDPAAQKAYLRDYAKREYVKAANAERYKRDNVLDRRHKRFKQLSPKQKANLICARKASGHTYAMQNRVVIASRVRSWRIRACYAVLYSKRVDLMAQRLVGIAGILPVANEKRKLLDKQIRVC
jgi:hypothetical protein